MYEQRNHSTGGGLAPRVKPFYFNTSAHLVRITRQKATTLAEFLADCASAPRPPSSSTAFEPSRNTTLFAKASPTTLRIGRSPPATRPSLAEGWPASMFASSLRWRVCARDLSRCRSFLRRVPAAGPRHARETFYFCAAESVVIPTKLVAHSLPEFAEVCGA